MQGGRVFCFKRIFLHQISVAGNQLTYRVYSVSTWRPAQGSGWLHIKGAAYCFPFCMFLILWLYYGYYLLWLSPVLLPASHIHNSGPLNTTMEGPVFMISQAVPVSTMSRLLHMHYQPRGRRQSSRSCNFSEKCILGNVLLNVKKRLSTHYA